ncbi:MAG: hypothetical protein ACHP65_06720, partial [Legionellales bacterium]
MTLKEVGLGFYNFPGTLISGVTDIIFGNDDEKGTGPLETARRLGLVGLVTTGLSTSLHAIAGFVRAHRQAITNAFWIALGVAAAVAIAAAVTAIFAPEILAAVVGFSLFGISVATLAGAGFIAQLGVLSGLAAAAAATATFAVATVYNAVVSLINCCRPKPAADAPVVEAAAAAPVVEAAAAAPVVEAAAAAPVVEAAAAAPVVEAAAAAPV